MTKTHLIKRGPFAGMRVTVPEPNPDFSTAESSADVIPHNGRWFINMGRPGFNCAANNRKGFASKGQATRVMIQHDSTRKG